MNLDGVSDFLRISDLQRGRTMLATRAENSGMSHRPAAEYFLRNDCGAFGCSHLLRFCLVLLLSTAPRPRSCFSMMFDERPAWSVGSMPLGNDSQPPPRGSCDPSSSQRPQQQPTVQLADPRGVLPSFFPGSALSSTTQLPLSTCVCRVSSSSHAHVARLPPRLASRLTNA